MKLYPSLIFPKPAVESIGTQAHFFLKPYCRNSARLPLLIQLTKLSPVNEYRLPTFVFPLCFRNSDANPFDVLLDTLYTFKDKHKEGSMTVILDEVQTLNHHKNSTLVNILSRVRKDNISVILASQDRLNSSLQKVYDYCGTHILFRPMGEEGIKAVAEFTKLNLDIIRTLPDFHCAIMGSIYSEYHHKNIQLKAGIIGVTYRPPYVNSYD